MADLWTANEQITEARLNQRLPLPLLELVDTTEDYLIPGWAINGYGTNGDFNSTDQIFYMPIFTAFQLTLTHIVVNVQTASATSGAKARLGIYNASFTSGQLAVGSILLDAGTVAIDSTGDKSISITQTLDGGWYFLAISAEVNDTKYRAAASDGLSAVPVAGRGGGVLTPASFTCFLEQRGAGTGENALPDPGNPGILTLAYNKPLVSVRV